MNPRPAPTIHGDTEAERFDNAVRKVFPVSKEEMQRREDEWQKKRSTKAKVDTVSIAIRKIRARRESGLCGACGNNPCKCKRAKRKQSRAAIQSPDMPRAR